MENPVSQQIAQQELQAAKFTVPTLVSWIFFRWSRRKKWGSVTFNFRDGRVMDIEERSTAKPEHIVYD